MGKRWSKNNVEVAVPAVQQHPDPLRGEVAVALARVKPLAVVHEERQLA